MNLFWPREGKRTDDGDRGIKRFTWKQPQCVSSTDYRRFHSSAASVRVTRLPHLIYLLDLAFHGSHHSDHRDSGPVEPPHPLRPRQHGHGGPSKPSLIKHMLPPAVCWALYILLARTIKAFKALPWATFTREWETCAMKTNHRLIKFIVIRWYVEFRKIEVSCAYSGGRAERSHLVWPGLSEVGLDRG